MEVLTGVYLFFILVSLYSVFLILLILFRNRAHLFDDYETKIFYNLSVVIPVYNKEDSVVRTIETIKNVDYPKDKMEILVIDDGSKDGSVERLKQIKGINLFVKGYNSGKADSVNYGIERAKGEIIVIIDADSYPERDAFKKMLRYFEDPETGAVTATCYVRNTGKIIEKMQAIEYFLIAFGRKLLDFVDSVYVTPGSLSMYRKSVLNEVGGFDKNNITEDIEIAWHLLKSGYKNRMCLSAKVGTDVPDNLKSWWRQRLRWDMGGLQTMYKYKNSVLKKEKQKMFGWFITPRFLISHILSITGFFIFLYVVGRKLSQFLLSKFYSFQGGGNLFEVPQVLLIPSVFTFFILVLFSITILFTYYGLRTMKRSNLGVKANLTVLIYLMFYLTLYPLVLLHSLYMLAIGDIKW